MKNVIQPRTETDCSSCPLAKKMCKMDLSGVLYFMIFPTPRPKRTAKKGASRCSLYHTCSRLATYIHEAAWKEFKAEYDQLNKEENNGTH